MKLVYDIGMYDGADTQYYLESGFRVVAVEAHPGLITASAEKFASQVAAGQLVLINAAVAQNSGQQVELITAESDLGSSSLFPDRLLNKSEGQRFKVETIALQDLFGRYGVPYFLKVDIEGADRECILALTKETKPNYLSFEAGEDLLEVFEHVVACGFTRFKIIDQTNFLPIQEAGGLKHRLARRAIRALGFDEPRMRRIAGRNFVVSHSAGPAPWESAGRWMGHAQTLALWKRKQAEKHSNWYDFHCA